MPEPTCICVSSGTSVHVVKSEDPYFTDCWHDTKTFDVRKNDRAYTVGDLLLQRQYDARTGTYTGRSIIAEITYVAHPGPFIPLADGYVILGVRTLTKWSPLRRKRPYHYT